MTCDNCGQVHVTLPKEGRCECGGGWVPEGGMNAAPGYDWQAVFARWKAHKAKPKAKRKRKARHAFQVPPSW